MSHRFCSVNMLDKAAKLIYTLCWWLIQCYIFLSSLSIYGRRFDEQVYLYSSYIFRSALIRIKYSVGDNIAMLDFFSPGYWIFMLCRPFVLMLLVDYFLTFLLLSFFFSMFFPLSWNSDNWPLLHISCTILLAFIFFHLKCYLQSCPLCDPAYIKLYERHFSLAISHIFICCK